MTLVLKKKSTAKDRCGSMLLGNVSGDFMLHASCNVMFLSKEKKSKINEINKSNIITEPYPFDYFSLLAS